MQPLARTWVELSRSALSWNFGQFQRFFENKAIICPVVKANAYGHDVSWVTNKLSGKPIWGYSVAYGNEALKLKPRVGKSRIVVLSAWQPEELPDLIRQGIELVVWDTEAVKRIAAIGRRLNLRPAVHVKVDTGTTRIGTRFDELDSLMATLDRYRSEIKISGVFSHYADSEAKSLSFAELQQLRFLDAAKQIRAPWQHIACTAASLRLPLRGSNVIRLGIGLYGLWPSDETRRATRQIHLRPVLSWKTRILQVKHIPRGTTVGYGRTFGAARAMRIGILPVGYADGYDRRASNASWVMIGGSRCPVIGRVSMNLMAVDVARVREARAGQIATLIGPGIEADALAKTWQTIHYEIVSRIHPAIPRQEVA